jgi:TonB family protein
MPTLGLAFAAALLLQTGAPAADPGLPSGARPSVITNPDWLRRPTGEDIARYYPEKASRAEVEGRATVSCKVNAEGLLVGCSVVDETPADYGFGSAALNMALLFKMRPMTKDGVPVPGGTVRIPIRFMLPKGPPEPMPSLDVAMRCYGFAAAKSEQTPTAPDARLAFFAWRLMVEVKLVPERLRPSELEARLLALRMTGTRQAGDPAFAAERQKCESLIKAGTADLDELVRSMADKP